MAKKGLLRRQPFQGKTAIICGGSRGIGLASAQEIVRLGGSVCLVARDPDNLDAVTGELRTLRVKDSQSIESIACDATLEEHLKPHFAAYVERYGVPDYLLNFVGYAAPKYIENLTIEDFRRAMEVNYMGQVVPTLILLPYFQEARKGYIVNTASILGYLGVMGYATYAPTKYAIVGFTEVLRHELKPYNLRFSILFPPDTDTPGFEQENRTKPKEWFVTSQVQLMSAEAVAEQFIVGLLNRTFYILVGQATLLWRVSRFVPGLMHAFSDREYHIARKKLGKI